MMDTWTDLAVKRSPGQALLAVAKSFDDVATGYDKRAAEMEAEAGRLRADAATCRGKAAEYRTAADAQITDLALCTQQRNMVDP